jgi:methylated-DNA-[protein]-cysteine S-methyltransferase
MMDHPDEMDRTDSDRPDGSVILVRIRPEGTLGTPQDVGMPPTTTTQYCYADSPLGKILLTGEAGALRGLFFTDHRHSPQVEATWEPDDASFRQVRRQLDEYFDADIDRRRIGFELPLALIGSPFELAVWAALARIPYGTTVSYGQIAKRIGRPTAARAVGAANGRNPVAIIIPCHRVIGADARLTGYGWGVERKAWLLKHEHQTLGARTPTADPADPADFAGPIEHRQGSLRV